MTAENDRTAAVLTPTQRKWIRGEKEYTGEYAKQQRYDRRQSIQERVEASIQDLSLLQEDAEGSDQKAPEVPIEVWDELLAAVRGAHPDPPAGDGDTLRRIAAELEEKADRVDN